jgi:hypothetical protein
MRTNLEFLHIMLDNPEKLIDPFYSGARERVVLTPDTTTTNKLMKSSVELQRFIDTYCTLRINMKLDPSDEKVQFVISSIIKVFGVSGMNFTPLSQYLMVHNLNYSVFCDLKDDEKRQILVYVLDAYIVNRHLMYSNHGYSNIVLQVMSDNYSHKRKSKAGIEKIVSQVETHGIERLNDIKAVDKLDSFYILPDKGDKGYFNAILKKYEIDFTFSRNKQDKYPDLLFKKGPEIFIVEHKNMKENGGGQDKQISEILDFIDEKETNPNVHYITYLDGIFSNLLVANATSKNLTQYEYLLRVLNDNSRNFFVNTFAFEQLLEDIIKKVD